jgi:hypothetical protein
MDVIFYQHPIARRWSPMLFWYVRLGYGVRWVNGFIANVDFSEKNSANFVIAHAPFSEFIKKRKNKVRKAK